MSVLSVLKTKNNSVVTVSPLSSVRHAAETMQKFNIAALVVVNGEEIEGVLTEREIARGFARHGERLSHLRVKDLIDREPVTITPDETLKRVMNLMTRHRVRHLPVLEDGKLSGIVSIGDVVKHRLDEAELESNVLRDAYIAAH